MIVLKILIAALLGGLVAYLTTGCPFGAFTLAVLMGFSAFELETYEKPVWIAIFAFVFAASLVISYYDGGWASLYPPIVTLIFAAGYRFKKYAAYFALLVGLPLAKLAQTLTGG